MNPEQILNVLVLLNTATRVAIDAGVNIQKFNEMVQRAQREGRALTDAELQNLADDAQAAIDRLRG